MWFGGMWRLRCIVDWENFLQVLGITDTWLDSESICYSISKNAFISWIGPFFGVIPNFWPQSRFALICGIGAANLSLTELLFYQCIFALIFTRWLVMTQWVPGHPTCIYCTEHYTVHCTVQCTLHCTINCTRTSEWLTELTFFLRNTSLLWLLST